MDEDYEDIRLALRDRGLTRSAAEFIIGNAQITGQADRLREELGVSPGDD